METTTKVLTVSVKSFSYHRGIPYDVTGNGGGYVFDCRALNNPGRYEEYKNLTGKDKAVEDFLIKYSQVTSFLELVEKMLSISIYEYIQLGYHHLEVNFGCTGGQHRSVYCAECISNFIKQNFPQVIVNLKHLELENKFSF